LSEARVPSPERYMRFCGSESVAAAVPAARRPARRRPLRRPAKPTLSFRKRRESVSGSRLLPGRPVEATRTVQTSTSSPSPCEKHPDTDHPSAIRLSAARRCRHFTGCRCSRLECALPDASGHVR
jgi:hypothetical protein